LPPDRQYAIYVLRREMLDVLLDRLPIYDSVNLIVGISVPFIMRFKTVHNLAITRHILPTAFYSEHAERREFWGSFAAPRHDIYNLCG
jgi:hypothetical protein